MKVAPMIDRRSLLLAAAAAGAPLPALAQIAPATDAGTPAATVVTHHTGTFNGRRVSYDAVVEPTIVADAAGRPAARLVSTAYVATGGGDPAARPVIFVFNGGPISPSDILHMGAFGPRRLAIPDDLSGTSYRVVDNGYTVLDTADIVFFDPAGTGYSRVLPGVDPKSYFSVTADGQQTAQFVADWSRRHGRIASPKFLFGESYGTMRAAAAANQFQTLGMPLDGVVLMGQALNIVEFSQRPTNIISYVVSLPTLAAIAWSHGKADLKGQSFDAFMAEVFAYARSDYLNALFQGAALDPARRQAVATRLAAYTAIPADFYLAHDLRITKERYRRELLRDQGLILGMTDARYKGPAGEGADPSMAVPKALEAAFRTYLRDELKAGDPAAYVTDSPVKGLDDWDWGAKTPFSDWPYPALLGEVFAANPSFRVMVANGYQDTQTTVGAARYLVDQSGWPKARTSLHFYQGGHMAYSVEDSLRRLTSDVRGFMASRS